jgi:isopentenyl diphosphate isomerase/L-lactate dehydrogenase-like FMN-dependent dehydrogenase
VDGFPRAPAPISHFRRTRVSHASQLRRYAPKRGVGAEGPGGKDRARRREQAAATVIVAPVGAEPLNVWDYERLAEEKLDPGAFGYFAGGAGDELTLRANLEAFRRIKLRPRMLVDVTTVSTRTTVLGHEVSMPLMVSPVAFQRLAHPDGEAATARAAARAGTIFCLSTTASASSEKIAAAAPDGVRWFQLYVFKDRGLTRALLEEAAAAGFSAVLLTVDLPRFGRRERDLRTDVRIPDELVPSLVRAGKSAKPLTPEESFNLLAMDVSWRDVEQFAAWSGLPVLVKGILTAEDALLAIESGAVGVVVSNHGGRQLDGVPASLEALPEVVEAVAGRVPVLMDGGIRRGTDVLKALALGAQATLAGRPLVWGLAAGGEDGAYRVLELLRDEIELGLALLGCRSPSEVTRAHVTA